MPNETIYAFCFLVICRKFHNSYLQTGNYEFKLCLLNLSGIMASLVLRDFTYNMYILSIPVNEDTPNGKVILNKSVNLSLDMII